MFLLFAGWSLDVVAQHPWLAFAQAKADGGEKEGERYGQTRGECDRCGGGDGAYVRVHCLQLRQAEVQGADREGAPRQRYRRKR